MDDSGIEALEQNFILALGTVVAKGKGLRHIVIVVAIGGINQERYLVKVCFRLLLFAFFLVDHHTLVLLVLVNHIEFVDLNFGLAILTFGSIVILCGSQ